MRIRTTFLGSMAILLVLSVAPASGQVKVVTTLPDLQSITEMIGGDHVDVFSIATGFQNPHFVDPKPSYILRLSRADMFVTVGLDLEIGWVPPLLNSARNAKIQIGGEGYVDVSKGVPLLQVPANTSREGGDIHIYGNPHYWLDPDNGKLIARNSYDVLVRLDPDHQADFAANLEQFDSRLDEKVAGWNETMQPFAGAKIIAYHNEWPYFEQQFALQIVDFLEPKPGIPPTPSQLAKVIETMKRDGINVIITSPYFTTDSADLVARHAGGKVVVLATSVGAFEEIETYFDLFDYNVGKMAEALN
jgi:zinc/manganese transport system substrate-binding protein